MKKTVILALAILFLIACSGGEKENKTVQTEVQPTQSVVPVLEKEIVDFLEENKLLYLATTGLDGNPRVRPVEFMLADKGKLWFVTANTKIMYKEMKKNPRVEYCVSNGKTKWIRINATVVFSDNMAVKEYAIEKDPTVKRIYKKATNPILATYYLKDVVAIIYEFGKNPKTYKF